MSAAKIDIHENGEQKASREYGISHICVFICLFKFDFWEKDELHMSQEYGLSPVCVRL